MIDREFYAVASENLKSKKLRRSVFSPTGRLMGDFESAKRDFEGTIGQEIGDIQYRISTGFHKFEFTKSAASPLPLPRLPFLCRLFVGNKSNRIVTVSICSIFSILS